MIKLDEKEETRIAEGLHKRDTLQRCGLSTICMLGIFMTVCLRYIADSDDAKDVLQDAFIKIFTKIEVLNIGAEDRCWHGANKLS